MRQAIQTRFMGPTNTKGSRVRAWCDAKSMTFGWDHSKNSPQNHEAAADALARGLGWLDDGSKLVGGGLPGSGYAFVIVEAE